jgi:hypothetical protein
LLLLEAVDNLNQEQLPLPRHLVSKAPTSFLVLPLSRTAFRSP